MKHGQISSVVFKTTDSYKALDCLKINVAFYTPTSQLGNV